MNATIQRKRTSFRLREDLLEKFDLQQIEDAISDVHSGNCFAMEPNESLDDFLARMEAEGIV